MYPNKITKVNYSSLNISSFTFQDKLWKLFNLNSFKYICITYFPKTKPRKIFRQTQKFHFPIIHELQTFFCLFILLYLCIFKRFSAKKKKRWDDISTDQNRTYKTKARIFHGEGNTVSIYFFLRDTNNSVTYPTYEEKRELLRLGTDITEILKNNMKVAEKLLLFLKEIYWTSYLILITFICCFEFCNPFFNNNYNKGSANP